MKKIYTENFEKVVLSQRNMEDALDTTDADNLDDYDRNYDDVYGDEELLDVDNKIEGTEADDLEDTINDEEFDAYYGEDLETYSPDDLDDLAEDRLEEEGETETDEIIEPEGYPEFSSVLQALRWAKHNNETVRINYVTLKGTNLVRDVEPHGDFFAQTTRRRNVAVWDDTIGGIRTYIVDNIVQSGDYPKGYKFVGEKFSPKFNFSRSRKNYRRRLRRMRNNK